MTVSENQRAWVTLLTQPSYLAGTLILHHSLTAVGSKYPLIVLVSRDLPKECRDTLSLVGIEVVETDKISPESESTTLETRFKEAWSKLTCFNLLKYDLICMLDSDMLVRKNMDELLELHLGEDTIAAAHACTCNPRKFAHYPADWTPENCPYTHPVHPPPMTADSPPTYGLLNSGLFVCRPSERLYRALARFVAEDPRVPTFQFADQDVLGAFFAGHWRALPYYYNALKTLRIVHPGLWRDEDVRNVHYILAEKPWMCRPENGSGDDGLPKGEYHEVNRWWWDAFEEFGREMERRDTEESRNVWQYVQKYVAPPEQLE